MRVLFDINIKDRMPGLLIEGFGVEGIEAAHAGTKHGWWRMGNGVLQAAAVEHGHTRLVSYDKAMKDDHKVALLPVVACDNPYGEEGEARARWERQHYLL